MSKATHHLPSLCDFCHADLGHVGVVGLAAENGCFHKNGVGM
ncbi:hypothetical protein RISK_000518 [Rhodopirellula islandica]|uniref:Uncharacterized protein n=1 Tax=Rhodopirellula islandica TaxID=595434 RepID=A0A0J1BLT0_RHOIS|nr:hypothetical protein RISK_000518 [Rhodopirellula islandica]